MSDHRIDLDLCVVIGQQQIFGVLIGRDAVSKLGKFRDMREAVHYTEKKSKIVIFEKISIKEAALGYQFIVN